MNAPPSFARFSRELGALARDLAAAAEADDALGDAPRGDLFVHLVAHGALTGALPEGAPVDPTLARRFHRAIALDGLAARTVAAAQALRARITAPDATVALRTPGSPELHVHEHLVAAMAPDARARRGVFYTPDALVGYVVRSVHALLGEHFDGASLTRGTLAVLDPAAGTGAFLRAMAAHERASPAAVVRGLCGIELLDGPRAIAELVVARETCRDGARATDGARVCMRAGDALQDDTLPIAHQGRSVVVLGNPPYSGHARSGGVWITELLRGVHGGASYTRAPDGASLGERNAKWLQDDYVRFVRLAHRLVAERDDDRGGLVAFVCNHGWLDHPTFRGMRGAITQDFDAIFVLDLHGNARRGERTPGTGAPDGNVFDVQQGVCIALLMRSPGRHRPRGRVRHADLWGTRAEKLAWLACHETHTTAWHEVVADAPSFAVTPARSSAALREEYQRFVPLDAALPLRAPALVTGRDRFAVDEDAEALVARLRALMDGDRTTARLRDGDRLDVARARAAGADQAQPVACLYRPLDVRHVLLHDALLERPRRPVTDLLRAGDNLALVARRQSPPGEPCAYFTVSRHPVVDGAVRSDNHGSESVFPLHTRTGPNLSPAFVRALCEHTGLVFEPRCAGPADLARAFGPDDVLAYVYAVLHTPGWRTRFAPLICQDFPRVPVDPGPRFASRVAFGHALVALHTGGPVANTARIVGSTPRIERVRHDPDANAVWLGDGARIEGVDAASWAFRVGTWSVLRKWLADRRGQPASAARLARAATVASTVAATLALMHALDL